MDWLFLSIIITVAFLPSIIYMVVVRNTEKYEREPWRAVIKSFLTGATFGIAIAAFLELIAVFFFNSSLEFLRGYEFIAEHGATINAIVLAVIIAPIIEEATKAYGVLVSRRYVDEVEDGLVYGASSGFGFASLENLLYEISALVSGGIGAWIAVSIIRSISSALLHGSATALTGFGFSMKKVTGRSSMFKGYTAAVLMHSSFNLLASIPILLGGLHPIFYLGAFILAIIYGLAAFSYIRRKIRLYDRPPRRRSRKRANRQGYAKA